MDAADHLLGYLKATLGQGILIPKGGGINLTAYSDSDWLGCPIEQWRMRWAFGISMRQLEGEYRRKRVYFP
ncbi:hypothetical protein Tco_1339789 [Tanacetum coccineum]